MMQSSRRKREWTGWMFVLPSLIVFTLFMFLPIILGFWYSLTNYTGLSKTYNFIGFGNYTKLFSDRYFKVSIKNNIIYAVLFSTMTMLISLILASLLISLRSLESCFEHCFFCPIFLPWSL